MPLVCHGLPPIRLDSGPPQSFALAALCNKQTLRTHDDQRSTEPDVSAASAMARAAR
jgi:hypothetical protein